MYAHVAIDSSAHESPEVLGPTMPGIRWDPRPEPSSSSRPFSFFPLLKQWSNPLATSRWKSEQMADSPDTVSLV